MNEWVGEGLAITTFEVDHQYVVRFARTES